MLRTSAVRRKRPRGQFVLKYLEGVPTPTKLIDHIAGADLSASSSTDFFSTVPRYINAQHEQRLSKLFFHHVLYPAGGARRPYQAVVVRGGRLVAPSPIVTTTTPTTITTTTAAAAASTHAPRDPLAVPEAWQHVHTHTPHSSSSTVNVTASGRPSPARRSFFYANASPSLAAATVTPRAAASGQDAGGRGNRQGGRFDFEMGQPRFSSWHAPASSATSSGLMGSRVADTATRAALPSAPLVRSSPSTASERETMDAAFAGLRGVVEEYWASFLPGTDDTQPKTDTTRSTQSFLAAVSQLQVNPSGGLLLFGAAVPDTEDSSVNLPAHPDVRRRGERQTHARVPHEAAAETVLGREKHTAVASILSAALRPAPCGGARRQGRHGRHVYMQTQLPSSACVRSCSASKGTERTCATSLAGDVVPNVSFAVGQPLRRQEGSSATHSADDENDSKKDSSKAARQVPEAFAHITAILRVDVLPASAAAPTTSTDADASSSSPRPAPPQTSADEHKRCPVSLSGTHGVVPVAEPWRLGHALDASLPYMVRTVTEPVERVFVHVNHHDTPQPIESTEKEETNTADVAFSRASPFAAPCAAGEACYECVLGRQDAESYLIPQRELVVELLVPNATKDLCQKQNDARVARQQRLGHGALSSSSSSSSSAIKGDSFEHNGFVWPSDQRLTSTRIARGRQLTMAEANDPPSRTKDSLSFSSSSSPSSSSSSAAAASSPLPEVVPPQLCHEVRALPGDVLFIPRRWGYRLKRVVGSSVLSTATTTTTGSQGDARDAESTSMRRRLRALTPSTAAAPRGAAAFSPDLINISPAAAAQRAADSQRHAYATAHTSSASATETTSKASPAADTTSDSQSSEEEGRVVGVDVDAWCLAYAPYPDLSADQAKVYVAANYVHKGVDAFYQRGGNSVYHVYE